MCPQSLIKLKQTILLFGGINNDNYIKDLFNLELQKKKFETKDSIYRNKSKQKEIINLNYCHRAEKHYMR